MRRPGVALVRWAPRTLGQAKEASKTAQDASKMAQDASKMAPGRPKTPRRRSETPPGRLKTRLRRPKTPLRCDFDVFWCQNEAKLTPKSHLEAISW